MLAVVLLLSGVYLYLHLFAEWLDFLVMGVGAGIAIALTGSMIHDVFAGQRDRR